MPGSSQREKDTCREFVEPKLREAGWYEPPHEVVGQHYFTDGRVTVGKGKPKRGKKKFADYLLRLAPDVPIAVVEAKRLHKTVEAGLQQAMRYAEILGLPFAYATNGREIVEHDYLTGKETTPTSFPTAGDLWQRYCTAKGIGEQEAARVLTPGRPLPDKDLRYYQESAVQRALEAVVGGDQRVLLTLATGTGKTLIAFQLCWRLWESKWNRHGAPRGPRMLYLSDRRALVDDPYKTFEPFGDAREDIGGTTTPQTRDMYFATYQALMGAADESSRYEAFDPGFFDLVLVDECHRGSAAADSAWRAVLDHFSEAVHVGMTATPLQAADRDTYAYFGGPTYEYSLKQGIEDGFLAPYRVYRVRTEWDAGGWHADPGTLDRYGREIPEGDYRTPDFDRTVALRARTEAIARHLTDFLKQRSDRFAKTIVFCVDQEHASEMRRQLNNFNADLTVRHQDYVCRITADEEEVGREHLDHFKDVERKTPVIVTTSHLLSTGVDMPTCTNIVLARPVGSMAEFKQIIGRGSRLRTDYGKYFFNILDYTGATRHFQDRAFDGYPDYDAELYLDEEGNEVPPEEAAPEAGDAPAVGERERPERSLKLYYDEGEVGIADERRMDLGPDGRTLRTGRLTDYAGDRVRTLFRSPEGLRAEWVGGREAVTRALAEEGIALDDLLAEAGQPDADPFDLLCSLAFDAPLGSRSERAARVRRRHADFFDRYGPAARAVLDELLDLYTARAAVTPFALPDALKVPPLDARGSTHEIAGAFGGAEPLREAVAELERLLYDES